MLWQRIKDTVKIFLPEGAVRSIRPAWHGLAAVVASAYYGNPSQHLIVIGITGTAGKSTTVNLLAHILNHTGLKTGFITTANFSYGGKVYTNQHGLSMPNEWLLQKQLRTMVGHGCKYAIIECTSEGLAQNRDKGINFDIALLTNLFPAHLDAHGGFENYKTTKAKLFESLHNLSRKQIFPNKIIGANIDSEHADYFLSFPADKKFTVSTRGEGRAAGLRAQIIQATPQLQFTCNDIKFSVPLSGEFNVANALLAIGCAQQLGISLEQSAQALQNAPPTPGRMETIPNSKGITIIVDYAPEPAGMLAALSSITAMPHNSIIHVFGSTGGHRDVQKRFEFGKLSAQFSDTIIITNDDVYQSNPEQIARDVRQGIEHTSNNLRKTKEIHTILDRKTAITTALTMAGPGDIVLITGKGSEQFLVLPGNKRIPWDDRAVVKEILQAAT